MTETAMRVVVIKNPVSFRRLNERDGNLCVELVEFFNLPIIVEHITLVLSQPVKRFIFRRFKHLDGMPFSENGRSFSQKQPAGRIEKRNFTISNLNPHFGCGCSETATSHQRLFHFKLSFSVGFANHQAFL